MKRKSLLRDRRGSAATVIAATIPLMLGGVALAVDTVQWTLAKRMMQRQADSAALAGVYGLSQRRDAVSAATRDLALNPGYALDGPPIIEAGPSTGPEAGNPMAVRVALATTLRLPFAGLFLADGKRISAEATASLVAMGELCVLSLNNTTSAGIKMLGNPTVDLGCGMGTNSIAGNAINTGGNSTVIASPLIASGGLDPSANYANGTVLQPYSVAQPDPYAGLADPTLAGNAVQMRVNPNQRRTFSPGTYRDVDIKGTAVLEPGTYFIDGGTFSANAQANISGQGVTIVLTSRTAAVNPSSVAGVDIAGGATINLTAPSSGDYKGILFYQDRRAADTTHKINGNSTSTMQGAFYFPSSSIEFNGTSGMGIDCIQLVAYNVEFRGNSTIRNNCPSGQGSAAISGRAVRLVG